MLAVKPDFLAYCLICLVQNTAVWEQNYLN